MRLLLRRVVALAWTLGILAMMLLPAPGSPSWFEHQDKVAHFLAFAGFGVAWTWARVDVRVVALTGVLLAVLTEYGQGLVPWPRTPEVADLVMDLAGLATGQLAAWWLHRRAVAGGPENGRAPRG